jgi:glycerol-3-phosphate acyltransferase PlsY
MSLFLWIFLGYLAGSLPFGLIVSRLLHGVDPRAAGSGNVGATNVARTGGKKAGVLVLACDLLKGLLIVAYAKWAGVDAFSLSLIALAVVCGHVFSIFLRFKGGKGVATTVGVLLPLAFWQTAVGGIICLAIAWRTGFVSLGSLAMMVIIAALLLISLEFFLLPLCLVLGALIFWTHRANIKRLAKGEEKPWNRKT